MRLFRGFRRSPSLTVAATLCTAIGVAATTAVATLANAALVRPVPFPDADRLVRVWLEEPGVDPRVWFSIPETRDLRDLPVFDAFLTTARVRAVGINNEGAERLRGEAVDPGYFERLGVTPAAGRLFSPADHAPGAAPVVAISHGLWTRSFGARPSAVGETLRTQRTTYTIVGILPPSFNGTVEDDQVVFWTPIDQYEPRTMITDRGARQTWVVASLRQGASLADAAAALDGVTREWRQRDPQRYRTLRLRVEPFADNWRAGLRGGTMMLGAASGLLLVIASLNVGCLLLARVLDRSREFAIRRALGASRATVVRQLMLESMTVCAGGGLLGIWLGPIVMRGLLAVSPIALPTYLTIEPDLRVALVSIAILFVTGLIAGVAPALAGSNARTADVLQAGSRGVLGAVRQRRWIPFLIAAEVALTLVILFAGGLLLRSFDRFSSTDLGYRRDGIARLAVTLSRDDAGTEAERPAVYARLREAAAAVPGVTSAGLVSDTLPPWDSQRGRLRAPELAAGAFADGLPMSMHLVDEHLFETLGIRLTAGRNFNPGERDEVAIVSRSVATRLGGEQQVLGRVIELVPQDMGDPAGRFRVVGVVTDTGWDGFAEQGTRRTLHYDSGGGTPGNVRDVYLPLARFPRTIVSIGAATDGDAAAAIDAVRRAIGGVAPKSAVHWTSTMADEVALEYAPARFYSVLVGGFSAGALLLTSVGLFALLWHTTTVRTGEMGLRLALGAGRGRIAGLIVLAAGKPMAVGSVCGMLGALWCGEWLRAFLYGVRPLDVVALAGALGLLLAVCVLASLLPARRAASVDPIIALKAE